MSQKAPPLSRDHKPCGLPTTESTRSFWHTEPSPLLTGHRSTRNLPSHADIVIIGSGITGASIAHHILDPEHGSKSSGKPSVVMLEAREACWGATGRNGGHCKPLVHDNPSDPSIGRFEIANLYALKSLIETRNIPCEFATQLGLHGIYTAHHVEEARSILEKLKQTAPDLASTMTLVTDPASMERLRLPTAHGVLISSLAARLWPYKLVAHILESLICSHDLNGTFNLQTWTPATAITQDPSSTWTITTPRGPMTTKHLILATNAYTSHLLPSHSDLIVPCRGQMSALHPLPSVADNNRLTYSYGFFGDGIDDYLIQRPNESGGQLMFGGGRQLGPSMGVWDDSEIDERTAGYLRGRLVGVLGLPEGKEGEVEFEAENEWTGIMGYSRDDRPWVGPVAGKKGLWISAGYTGHGMPNAWLCGKAVAEMVLHEGEDNVEKACEHTGLPKCYLATEQRTQRVRAEMEDVVSRDWAEMKRAGR